MSDRHSEWKEKNRPIINHFTNYIESLIIFSCEIRIKIEEIVKMSQFRAEAEKMMKEFKASATADEKKIRKIMNAAVQEINSSKHQQDELKKKYMQAQMKNARIYAENKQSAKNAEYLQQQLINFRSSESTIVSEAMRLAGLVSSRNPNTLSQDQSKDNGTEKMAE